MPSLHISSEEVAQYACTHIRMCEKHKSLGLSRAFTSKGGVPRAVHMASGTQSVQFAHLPAELSHWP